MYKASLSVLAAFLFAGAAHAQTSPAPAPVRATGMAPMEAGAMHDMPAKPAQPAQPATPMGGGPGKVWVNKSSKVYHCQDDKFYGKTKHGEYMLEADAKAKGFHVSGGKACKG